MVWCNFCVQNGCKFDADIISSKSLTNSKSCKGPVGGSYWYEYLASCMPQRPNITVQETQAWSKIPEKIAFYKTIGTVGR